MSGRRRALQIVVVLTLIAGLAAYATRSAAISRELREGREAYDALCDRIAAEAEATGNPGSLAHLFEVLQIELRRLEREHPRWYAEYRRDPGSHTCSAPPGTRVGDDT